LAEGEAAHPTYYRGCSHAKEEVQGKPKNHNRKNVLFKFDSINCVLCSGAPWHHRAKSRETVYTMKKHQARKSTGERKRNNSMKQTSQLGLQL
jgi:3'-phosphoadenosine 5'-phosphosulfate sulfotransferase (PAPS reductase)/FAD synthetase